jgi:predicted O-methyltransferase YrrM
MLWSRVVELQPSLVVECGSGVSTVLFAAAVPSARVVAFEDLREHADKVRAMLEERNLTAEVVVGGLVGHRLGPFYDVEVPDGVDFALIDGPRKAFGGRRQTFESLWPHLSDDWEVWLDDVDRVQESRYLRRWASRFPVDFEVFGVGGGRLMARIYPR